MIARTDAQNGDRRAPLSTLATLGEGHLITVDVKASCNREGRTGLLGRCGYAVGACRSAIAFRRRRLRRDRQYSCGFRFGPRLDVSVDGG